MEKIETKSPKGRLVFHVFAALAEFERNLIHERTVAGVTAARARGRKGGRPPQTLGQRDQDQLADASLTPGASEPIAQIGVLFFCGCGQSYPRSKKWIFEAIVLLICGLVFS